MLIVNWDNYSPGFNSYHLTRLTEYSGNTYPLHKHKGQEEIMLILDGFIKHSINGRKQRLEKGDVLHIKENDCHSLNGGSGMVINIAFTCRTLERLSLTFSDNKGALPDHFEGKQLERFKEYINEMGLGAGKNQLLLWEFLIWFFRQTERNNRIINSDLPAWLVDLLKKCEQKKNLDLKQLYKMVDRTPEHISRTFRKYLSCTPGEYVNKYRIRAVKSLLTTTRFNITDIALDCGFESLSYFYQVFKELTGESPGEYRKRERRNPYLLG
jgi:AraC-like DNA-binding protein